MAAEPTVNPADPQRRPTVLIACLFWGFFTRPIWWLSSRLQRPRYLMVHLAMALALLFLDAAFDKWVLLPFLGLDTLFGRDLLDLSWIDLSSYFFIVVLERVQRFQFESADFVNSRTSVLPLRSQPVSLSDLT